ncbi:beta-carotene 15,15'-monooxygenase, Brp/Blh family [Cyclobacterium xiamenense]|uniref:Probable beta-carotene 15,15'-dioxygenase n=1 Tax=Cyclobacterium xiamenense TaxID=1297121 RepID=A0A1H6TDP5_9BACT|nr:Brp/Blh family beta-carotene 15,15'-dioxygenase [Cyclobacterium xiamenense]SEI78111.1 beta-carotene 15,15'-monooxygenase, Brp/Blh family [Cyclobacterium xiamenense]
MRSIENGGKLAGVAIALIYLFLFRDNPVFEWVLIGIVLVTVGIPHGSLDHLLLNPSIGKVHLLKFIGKYLAIILVYLSVWLLLPVPALLAFLAMSAYHFGQSHFIHTPLFFLKKTTYLLTGVFYLSVLFWGDFASTTEILGGIADTSPLAPYGWYVIIGSFSISAILIIRNLPRKWWLHLVEMLLMGSLFYHLPLLLGFILYFGFWHSLPSMQVEYSTLKHHFGPQGLKTFIGKMIPFTAASILGMSAILAIVYPRSSTEELILLFFVLVSLISAPHIWYMNRFLESR